MSSSTATIPHPASARFAARPMASGDMRSSLILPANNSITIFPPTTPHTPLLNPVNPVNPVQNFYTLNTIYTAIKTSPFYTLYTAKNLLSSFRVFSVFRGSILCVLCVLCGYRHDVLLHGQSPLHNLPMPALLGSDTTQHPFLPQSLYMPVYAILGNSTTSGHLFHWHSRHLSYQC